MKHKKKLKTRAQTTIHYRQSLQFETLEPRHMLSGNGLLGEYYENSDLTVSAGTRVDASVNFPNDALGDGAQGMVASDDSYNISSPSSTTDDWALHVERIVADFDNDDDVDGADFLAWQRGFGMPSPTANKEDGDADNDSDVDSADLAIWESQFGQDINNVNQPPAVTIDSTVAVPQFDGVFQEQNGLVVMEIESRPVTGSWELQSSVDGFTGDGYYRWEGPNLFNESFAGSQGIIEYKINITNPGTYQMRFRNHRDSGTGTEENDVWAKMDDGDWNKVFSYASTAGSWNWVSRFDIEGTPDSDASYELTAGEHRFFISGRSNGFRIDRVVLYNTSLIGENAAQNLSNPESPLTGESLVYQLDATVVDDGQVLAVPQLQWSLDSGPGTATFSDPQSEDTSVEFSVSGQYVVRLSADDGEQQTSATQVIFFAAPATGLLAESKVIDFVATSKAGDGTFVVLPQQPNDVIQENETSERFTDVAIARYLAEQQSDTELETGLETIDVIFALFEEK